MAPVIDRAIEPDPVVVPGGSCTLRGSLNAWGDWMDKRSRVTAMWLAILIGQCAVITPVLAQSEQSEADKVFASRTQPIEIYASGLGTFEKPISTSNGNG